MASGNFYKSDLFNLHHLIQASMISYPKEMIISTLRDFFSKDSYYHYESDEWGFPKTQDHNNLPLGQGLTELTATTRLYIGENYRYDGIYYPAILVKNAGTKSVPISINREKCSVKYKDILYQDGYGNEQVIKRPYSFITAGAWEGAIAIDVVTRSIRSRDDLVELIGMCFTEIYFEDLFKAGIVVKPLNVSSPSEADDRNDKLFKQTITLDIRTEWRREIPVGNLIESVFFAVDFSNISAGGAAAPNIAINTNVSVY